jgi:hypothetical protein
VGTFKLCVNLSRFGKGAPRIEERKVEEKKKEDIPKTSKRGG